MDHIYEPNNTFNFDDITLAQPTSIQGGFYFTKIQVKNKPLYIETPNSLTKQGFIKTGKKMYCELMFNNNNVEFINWIEQLESKCQELIYEKSDDWFENKLDKSDIEGAFTSPIRIFKSGKNYLLRVNTKLTQPSSAYAVKIYNENEETLTTEDIKEDTNIISILEIQGIKFTSRNFQIEIEIKQIMVINNDKIFEKCLIKHSSQQTNESEKEKESEKKEKESEKKEKDEDIEEPLEEFDFKNENPDDLIELNISSVLETYNKDDTIKLKKPNQVYYEIYKVARKKAKDAKKQAIVAFLEAKSIKKTYMLDDLDSSDTDSDIDSYLEK
jgi:hypothetical protein